MAADHTPRPGLRQQFCCGVFGGREVGVRRWSCERSLGRFVLRTSLRPSVGWRVAFGIFTRGNPCA
jgi:hypothetical protein